MKTFATMLAVAATSSWLASIASYAGPTVAGGGSSGLVTTLKAPSDDNFAAAKKLQADAARQYEQAMKQFEQADQQFSKLSDEFQQLAQAEGAEDFFAAASSSGDSSSPWAAPGPGFSERLTATTRRASSSPPKAMVIYSGESDSATQASLEEDLAVMSHIFDKATEDSAGGEKRGRTAMGINVFFAPGSNPIRSLYVEGYGALFMLRVNFPLLAPPKASEEPKEKPAADSNWEQARREVYGQPGAGKAVNAGPEYDAGQVSQLKDALIEAFKNAANIRGLKSDDSITVCVFGGASSGPMRLRKVSTSRSGSSTVNAPVPSPTTTLGAEDRARQFVFVSPDAGPTRGTIMTLRAKKIDVDSFAKGRLTAEEFRKKLNVAIYQGYSDSAALGGGGTFAIPNGVGGGSFTVPNGTSR